MKLVFVASLVLLFLIPTYSNAEEMVLVNMEQVDDCPYPSERVEVQGENGPEVVIVQDERC